MRVTSSMLSSLNSMRMNSIRSSWSSNSSRKTNGLASNSLRNRSYGITNTSTAYQTTQKAAANVRTQAEKLTSTDDQSLWSKAEKSGNKQEILKTVNEFVNHYNDMIGGMQKNGGSLNNIYRAQLNRTATANQSILKDIGISTKRDGTLVVDQNKLKGADVDKLKEAFGGSASFAGGAAVKSIYVEANAVSGMSQQSNAAYTGYNSLGSFYNYGTAGASLGNYFSSFF